MKDSGAQSLLEQLNLCARILYQHFYYNILYLLSFKVNSDETADYVLYRERSERDILGDAIVLFT